MSNFANIKVGDLSPARSIAVTYYGADALVPGMALCFDITNATAGRAGTRVVKPTLALVNHFAGVVADGQQVAATASATETTIQLIPVDNGYSNSVPFYTDQTLVVGDILGVIPGEYYLGRCIVGQPVGIVVRAATVASTATTGECKLGWVEATMSQSDIQNKITRHFDHFTRSGALAGVANLHDYELVGTGGLWTLQDGKAIAATDTTPDSTLSGGGVVGIVTATSGFLANVALPGEPFALAAGMDLFFRCRFALASTTTAQAFIGLGTAAVTDAIDTGDTDGIGFRVLATVLDFVYAKDATPSVIETLTGWTAQAITTPAVAATVFVDVAFMVRNAITQKVSIFANGTQIAHTVVVADIVDNESLTLRLAVGETGSDAAMTLLVDRLEINNYRT